jgi:hypothetical protein
MKTIIRVEHLDGNGMFIPKTERFSVGDNTPNAILNRLWKRHTTDFQFQATIL